MTLYLEPYSDSLIKNLKCSLMQLSKSIFFVRLFLDGKPVFGGKKN